MAALLTSDVLEVTCTYRHSAIATGYDLIIYSHGRNKCIIKTEQGGVCHKVGVCNVTDFIITKCEEIPEQVTIKYTIPGTHQLIYGSWACGYGNTGVNEASIQIEQLGQ